MRFLVTGGAGFIGSHVTEALLARGDEVIVLDNFSTGSEANLCADAETVRGEAGDDALLDRVVPGCEGIFHLAAVSSVQASLDKPRQVHDANLTATLSLLEAARRHNVRRFVFSSSAAVYGDTKGEPAREDMKPNPLSHYAVQKLACEYYCGVYTRIYGLETVCLRYFNIFGPRQRADSPYSGVIARFIDAARNGRPATIFGDGSQTRDLCAVANVVDANLAAAKEPSRDVAGGIFNIGTGNSVSVKEVVDTLAQIFPSMPKPIFAPKRSGEVSRSCADIKLAQVKLGYEPDSDFTRALRCLAISAKPEHL
jgi:nucleoside-diphosphate-sugar epimerase